MDKTVAINFQLLGGIWILQTLPTVVGGLFTRWAHRWALLAGWAAGMTYGTWHAADVRNPLTHARFGGSSDAIPWIGRTGYIGLTAVVLNLLVVVVLTVALRLCKVPDGADETRVGDFTADVDGPVTGAAPEPEPPLAAETL
jgi:SSS family solute:Na+ symporter